MVSTFAALTVGLLAASCNSGETPLPPEEALRLTAIRINEILEADSAESVTPVPPAPAPERKTDASVTFWYYAHPIIAPAMAPREDGQPLKLPGHRGIRLDPQFIGEWPSAIQKLTVSLAAEDLPDAAMVKRGWLARLYAAGRIRPLEVLLPTAFLVDLRPEIVRAYSVDGHLVALPADGFCTLLLCNRAIVKDLPQTWTDLRTQAEAIRLRDVPGLTYPIGGLPFLETLWSAGGKVVDRGRCGLDAPEALRALRYLLSLRSEGLAAPLASGDAAGGLELFLKGQAAYTAASSEYLPRIENSSVSVGYGPLPGETGSVSGLSNNAVVFFVKRDAVGGDAVAALADFLTGDAVQGAHALELGSVPVRKSVAEPLHVPRGLERAFVVARGTPLIASWNEVEFELTRYLNRAYQWQIAGTHAK